MALDNYYNSMIILASSSKFYMRKKFNFGATKESSNLKLQK